MVGEIIFLQIKSTAADGKFYDNETGKEFTEEEAIEQVQEYWRDMAIDYCSWDLEKVYFKYYDKDL